MTVDPYLKGQFQRGMVVMMFWYGAHWAFWQAGLMWVAMIAFWGLLIWGVYALITTGNHQTPAGPRSTR